MFDLLLKCHLQVIVLDDKGRGILLIKHRMQAFPLVYLEGSAGDIPKSNQTSKVPGKHLVISNFNNVPNLYQLILHNIPANGDQSGSDQL